MSKANTGLLRFLLFFQYSLFKYVQDKKLSTLSYLDHRIGCRMLDIGCRMLDVGCRMLDVGWRMLDVGCRIELYPI